MAKPKEQRKLYNPIEAQFDVISRYHYFLFGCLFLSKIPIIWHLLNIIFLAPRMDFYCVDGGAERNNASRNVCPCELPRWDLSTFSKTMQTKFGAHCEREWLIGLSHSIVYSGGLCGSFIFGFLSDRFGRLAMFCLSILIMAVFGCVVIFMPTLSAYTFIRYCGGIGIGGAIVTGYVLCVEYCGVRQRAIVTALFHIPLNIGHMALAAVSYFLRDCDDFQLAISVPLFFFIPMNWCLLESPKWLMDSNQIDKAALVMEKVSKFNKTSCGEIKTKMEEYIANRGKNSVEKVQFWHIFKHIRLTINFFCMAYIYFVCGMGYYGVSQYIGQMMGDIHINVAISGALLLPGTLSATVLLHILSRRTFLMATNLVAGICILIVVLIPLDHTWARVLIACICNSAFFISFMIVFLYGVELFPTAVRNSVLGILTVMARAGQITAPLINHLPETASGSIFGGLAIFGGLLCIPLPETKDTELPSSLEESTALPRKNEPQAVNEGNAGIHLAT